MKDLKSSFAQAIQSWAIFVCPAPVESAQLKVEKERGRIKRKGRKTMPRKTYKPEEIVGILRDAEIKQGQGLSVANICR